MGVEDKKKEVSGMGVGGGLREAVKEMQRTLQRRTRIQLVWAQGLCSYGASKFLIIAIRLRDITSWLLYK